MKLLEKNRDIYPIREQYRIMDEILKDRIDNLMPKLMKECGIDMWLIASREYNEDPVFKTITPALVKSASRMSCFIFSIDKDGQYEALSVTRPNPAFAPFYTPAYLKEDVDQFAAIKRIVSEKQPKSVAVNISESCAQADGLSKMLYDQLFEVIGDKMVPDDRIAVRWLETRVQKELELYPQLYKVAMDVLKEAYSLDVITPSVTTTTDVEYYIMQRISDMGLEAWFSPDVDLQRQGSSNKRMTGEVIEKGDLLHTDMGITYMGLNTDSQRLAYVLKDGEKEIPKGILEGMKVGNRFQDIVRENYIEGRSGNEIFIASMEQAKKENIKAMLYTHPIGFYGHGAGPTIGLYDRQEAIPVRGDRILYDSTCYALELNTTSAVPEWDGQEVCFMIEETIAFKDGKTSFKDDDREKIIAIG